MERKCSVLWKWFDLLNWTPISCTLPLNNQNSLHDYHLSVPTGIVEDQLINTQPTLELTFILYKMTQYYFNQIKAILIFNLLTQPRINSLRVYTVLHDSYMVLSLLLQQVSVSFWSNELLVWGPWRHTDLQARTVHIS